MARELVIYCDESVGRGEYFSNFYGGILVESSDLAAVISNLQNKKDTLGLTGELKWQGVTPSVGPRYRDMMDALFDELEAGRAKIRIMFTQNQHVPVLTREQRETRYHRLYFQLVKHAFGLQYAGRPGEQTNIRILLDKMPATAEQVAVFRSCLAALSRRPEFRRARVVIREDQIAEIDSKKHILSQCLDVVLGAMAFRLNDRHKVKPPGSRIRGKRTREKEQVYRHIRARIAVLYPRFNIGTSTGQQGSPASKWEHPYRHWKLVPKDFEYDRSRTKGAKRKTP